MKQRLEKLGVFQQGTLAVEEIPFSPAVTEACKANRCGKYATCWTCPPGLDPAAAQRKIRRYATAWVFTCKYDLEDPFDYETMVVGAKTTHKKLLDLAEALRKEGVDFMALGCEGCVLCDHCIRRLS